ncbi:NALCN channel auxiliary factor 2-like [Acipenser ruthenus]|uniref:NALCN channel auxiliary factor 2-like n=1 Tax=Acipenser ruthenus TaxID=7906 RepID=UPI001560EF20|nr:NALCN channel auxiliary factor 2-like [Acipenser ruthenus]
MIRGAWMYRREDDAVLKICCAPKQNDKPCADSERAQKWRMSLASLLFFTVLLSDHLWLCAGAKLRSKHRGLRTTWGNATDVGYLQFASNPPFSLLRDQLVLNKRRCDIFLSNSTKSAAPSPRCTEDQDHLDLESACTKLHLQQPGFGSSLSASSSPSPSSTEFLLSYFRNLSLSFCDSYSVSDLLVGMVSPDGLDCSLQNMLRDLGRGGGDDGDVCSNCIQAYVRLDQHAQEKYEEFDFLFLKYLQSEDFSVRSCIGDCKAVYKAWLCAEYFNATQSQCQNRIPCKQYCLEVQTSCPFVLPDNDDLIYGGLSSFICTGLLEDHLTNEEPECCDVRWSSCGPPLDGVYNASTKFMDSSMHHHRTSLPVSAASRLCNSRLKLCVLVLILLHTVVTFSTIQNNGGVNLEALTTMEDSSTREE